jgi:hypothetical protein
MLTTLLHTTDWMNNFIVGQVTPDMLSNITYGTYIFFGVITTIGALFIAFLVPETKQLSLGKLALTFSPFSPSQRVTNKSQTEEMDVIFGSEGVAATDYERQAEIAKEVGLDAALTRLGHGGDGEKVPEPETKNEKDVTEQSEVTKE